MSSHSLQRTFCDAAANLAAAGDRKWQAATELAAAVIATVYWLGGTTPSTRILVDDLGTMWDLFQASYRPSHCRQVLRQTVAIAQALHRVSHALQRPPPVVR